MIRIFFVVAVAGITFLDSVGSAVTIDETRTLNDFTATASCDGCNDFTNPQTLTFDNLPNTPLTDATLTITVDGDFNQELDNVQVELEALTLQALDLGIFLNNVPGDDLFDHGTDVGQDFVEIVAQTTLSQGTLDPMMKDNELVFTVTFGPNVMHFNANVQTLELRLQVEAEQIPEPAAFTIGMIAIGGLVGLAWRRRRKTV